MKLNLVQQLAKHLVLRICPDEPVTKDKPKKSLILVLGLILGFMLGCFGALINQKFKNNDMMLTIFSWN